MNLISVNGSNLPSKVIDLLKSTIGIKSQNQQINKNRAYSKFGGTPDVPPEFEYPLIGDQYLSFLCQINLDEIRSIGIPNNFPDKGMLYFFALTKGLNRYPNQKEEYRVVNSDSILDLSRYEFDKKKILPDVYNEEIISFYPHFTLPEYASVISLELQEYEDDIDELNEEISKLTEHSSINNGEVGSQLNGHPRSIQQPVMYLFTEETGSKQNTLLLQMDFTTCKSNFSDFFGNSVAYFIIKNNDLQKLDFRHTRLIVQND